jgi:hypothetical protein
LELHSREPYSRAKSPPFTFQIAVGDLGAVNVASAFVQTQHAANYDAVRNRETFAMQLLADCERRLRLDPFVLIEGSGEKTDDRFERFCLVVAGRDEFQAGAVTSGEGQDVEDRFGVGFRATGGTLQREFASESFGDANEVGRGASVKTETAGYLERAFGHR